MHEKKVTQVFFFGQNRELALYRAEFLRNMGDSVLLPKTKEQAINDIQQRQFDVAILSYTLSDDTVKELSDLIRQACPECPLLTISKGALDDPHIGPDAIIQAEAGPAGLAAVLHSVLGKHLQ